MVYVVVAESDDRCIHVGIAAVPAGVCRVARLRAGGRRDGLRIAVLAVGRHGDGQIARDLRQPVAVLDPRFIRQFQILVVFGGHGDIVEDVALAEHDHEVDLPVAAAVDQAAVAVARMGGLCVLHVFTVKALLLVDGDGGAVAAHDSCGPQDLAAHGADPVLIIVGDLRKDLLIGIFADRAGVGA